MGRVLVTSAPLNPRLTSLVMSVSTLSSPVLSIRRGNNPESCGHNDQFWDSQDILGDSKSHDRRKIHTWSLPRDIPFLFFLGPAHTVWKFSVFTALDRVELLWFHLVPVTQGCTGHWPEGKETDYSGLTIFSSPNLEETVLSLLDHQYKSCRSWGSPKSWRLLVLQWNNWSSSFCWPSSYVGTG